MSSENRAPSAVRNLRSLFENKASLDSSSPDSRGRSPSGLGGSDKENGSRPRSKIRASFVPVELAGMTTATTADGQGSAGLRRGSFSEMDGDGALSDLKRTISEQQGHHLVPEGAVESAAGSVAATPNKKPGEGRLGHDMPPENPDKAVTGHQESSDMKSADLSSEKAVSGGDALPPVAEDLRFTTTKKPESRKPTTNGKPAAISTKSAPRASSSAIKSPATQPKTPTSAKVPTSSTNAASTLSPSHKQPLKKASRSSLTAPTAASLARSGAAGSEKAPSTKTSPTAKPKAREVTKPINLPSHLTAPTASSRAKHEPETATVTEAKPREVTKPVNLPSHLTAPTASSRAKHEREPAPVPSTSRTTTTSRPKATTTHNKSAARASLPARPASRDSTTTRSRKSTAPAEGSFLDRMTKPTTASSNRTMDKHEVDKHSKSKTVAPAAKAAPATKAKVNGTKATPKDTAAVAVDRPAASAVPAESSASTKAIEEESTGSPIGKHVSNESFKGTPATDVQRSDVTADTDGAGEALTFAEGVHEENLGSAEPEVKADAGIVSQSEPGLKPRTNEAGEQSEAVRETESTVHESKGNDTPVPHTNGEGTNASLEATPAAIGDEETIR